MTHKILKIRRKDVTPYPNNKSQITTQIISALQRHLHSTFSERKLFFLNVRMDALTGQGIGAEKRIDDFFHGNSVWIKQRCV